MAQCQCIMKRPTPRQGNNKLLIDSRESRDYFTVGDITLRVTLRAMGERNPGPACVDEAYVTLRGL